MLGYETFELLEGKRGMKSGTDTRLSARRALEGAFY